MKVITHHNVVRQTLDIYIQVLPERYLAYDAKGRHITHDVPSGSEPPIFLRLPTEIMERIITAVQEGGGVPGHIDVNYYKHLLENNDRLMKMVEQGWDRLLVPPVIDMGMGSQGRA